MVVDFLYWDTFNQTDVDNDQGIASADPFTPHAGPLDPRLDYTVGRRGIDYNGFWDQCRSGLDSSLTIRCFQGHIYQKRTFIKPMNWALTKETGAWGQQHSGINYNVMRYADVLLMAAEAAVESTGDLATALNYVNQIRNRAKDMTYVLNEAGDADAANYQIETICCLCRCSRCKTSSSFLSVDWN